MSVRPCEMIAKFVGELYKCSPLEGVLDGHYIRIETPYIFPDGDVMEFFYHDTAAGPSLTDFGETMRWISGQTAAERRSKRQQTIIQDVCENHHVEFSNGRLTVRVPSGAMMADAITRIAQAALRISDLSFTFRSRLFESFSDEVADFLAESKISFERHHEIAGEAKVWTVDFRATQPAHDALMFTLSTETQGAARRLVEHVVTAYYDLQKKRNGTRFVSLFDDSVEVWKEEDFKLLDPLSEVQIWSKRDELSRLFD